MLRRASARLRVRGRGAAWSTPGFRHPVLRLRDPISTECTEHAGRRFRCITCNLPRAAPHHHLCRYAMIPEEAVTTVFARLADPYPRTTTTRDRLRR